MNLASPRGLFACLFTLALAGLAHAADARPNVLFLFSDDLRPELGCYGTPGIKTPHLDALARRSVRFNQAFVQYPLCNPSRTSMLTGRYPTTTGVMTNRLWVGGLHPEWPTLPRYFRDNGYETFRAGKIFHGGIDDHDAWSEGGQKRTFEGAHDTRKTGQIAANSDRIVVLEGEGESHGDYVSATRTVEYLKKAKESGRPFFIGCGFSKPHSPPTAPKKFFDLYKVDEIPLPVDFASRPTPPAGVPAAALTKSGDLFIGREASERDAREMKRAYWASVSFMDAQVGRVLAALKETGLDRNTIVVFWGDHGYHLGEKGKWSKHNSLFEIGTRVPLMISVPGGVTHGKVSERVVESLDLYPTLLDLCALPPAKGLEGVSLQPLLRDPAAAWDRPAFSFALLQGMLGRAVRTDRWRYAEWDEGRAGAFLFDRRNDPHELKNLVADPAQAATVAAMKQKLARFRASHRGER
jgi:arylsulfatase A-like enzyme